MTTQDKLYQNENVELREHEEHWVAVSDLMGGLMMVFLLIAVLFMVKVQTESQKIKDVAILYDHLRSELYEDLYNEFKDDLPRWGAELNKDLSFRFYNSELLFETGESSLNNKFQTILTDFFPRYTSILTSDKYRSDITEVRVEGHTSSQWTGALDNDDAYVRNMELSQARTRSTLGYLLGLNAVFYEKPWIKQHLTANGLSSSKLIFSSTGKEDSVRSRRVEFRVITDAEARIATILQDVN